MAKTISFTNFNYAYIENDPFIYPANDTSLDVTTGYHYIPNRLFRDWMTAAQYYQLTQQASKYRVSNIEVVIQNLIPLTDQLAIQATASFTGFNNTIYAICFQDNNNKFYQSTSDIVSSPSLERREGLGADGKRFVLPEVKCEQYNNLSGCFADPLIDAENIMELRPGKNAVKFSSPINGSWKTTTRLYYQTNTEIISTGSTQKPVDIKAAINLPFENKFDSNMAPEEIQPHATTRQLVQTFPKNSMTYSELGYWIAANEDYVYATQPPPNFILKLIPLFDSSNSQLKATGQIGIYKKITFEYIPFANPLCNRPTNLYWEDSTANLFASAPPEFMPNRHITQQQKTIQPECIANMYGVTVQPPPTFTEETKETTQKKKK